MNFCRPETSPCPTIRAIGSILLRSGQAKSPCEVVAGVELGLLLAEERGEAVMEIDQLLGGGAHLVRRHGGLLLTDGSSVEDRPVLHCRAFRLSDSAAKARFSCCCRSRIGGIDGRNHITGNAREWGWLRALELSGRGWHQGDIAEALGVRDEAISRWLARAREGGPEVRFAHPPPGRPLRPAGAEEPDPGVPLAKRIERGRPGSRDTLTGIPISLTGESGGVRGSRSRGRRPRG